MPLFSSNMVTFLKKIFNTRTRKNCIIPINSGKTSECTAEQRIKPIKTLKKNLKILCDICIISLAEYIKTRCDSAKTFLGTKGEPYEKIYCGNDGGYHAAGTCLHTCACTERSRRSIGCSTERSRRKHSRRKRAISFPLTTKSAAKHAMTNSFSLSTATLLLQAPGLSSPAKLTGRM